MSNYEKETIIVFNEAEPTANVYTCNQRLKSKLIKLLHENENIKLDKQDNISMTFTIPKKWVKVSSPRKVSEEFRQKASERFKEMWKNKVIEE